MGLDIVVGVLPNLRENDPEGYERLRFRFGLLNIYLERAGLPKHAEPENCEVWSCQMYGYSGLHYLRRIAAHIDSTGILPPPGGEDAAHDAVLQNYYTGAKKKKSGFDHLILHNDDDGLYLPHDLAQRRCRRRRVVFPPAKTVLSAGSAKLNNVTTTKQGLYAGGRVRDDPRIELRIPR